MTSELSREYLKQRRFYPGAQALRAARVELAFAEAEEQGLVRLHCEPEFDYYDDSYIDTLDMSEGRKARAKRELADKIDREGHWVLFGQFRNASGQWETADCVGGFIGTEFKNSGYDVDLKLQALVAAGVDSIMHNISARF